jgi:hypothetical protein
MLRLADQGGRLRFLSLWQRWEPIAMRLWRVRPARPGALLQFGVSSYRGHTTLLLDGTCVEMGDRILHLHLDNRLLAQLSGDGRLRPWELVERARDDIDTIAEEVASGRLGEVRALRGVTILAAAATRAGFEVRPLPRNLRWALIRNISALVLASYHPRGIAELDRGLPWPGEVWMSSRFLETRLKAAAGRVADRTPSLSPRR